MATLQHTDELYHILEDEICALKILPGEALSENQLCKRFGVSRTPIRSVLQRLEQNRFVQIIPCKGTIVTPIDLDIVDQIVYQRTAVESTVGRAAQINENAAVDGLVNRRASTTLNV